jgi:hypothetical protein
VATGATGAVVLRDQLVEQRFPDELEQRLEAAHVAFAQAQVDADRFGAKQVGRPKIRAAKRSHHPLGQQRPGPRHQRLPAAGQKAAVPVGICESIGHQLLTQQRINSIESLAGRAQPEADQLTSVGQARYSFTLGRHEDGRQHACGAFGERLAVVFPVDVQDVLGGAVQVILGVAIGERIEPVADASRVEHDHFAALGTPPGGGCMQLALEVGAHQAAHLPGAQNLRHRQQAFAGAGTADDQGAAELAVSILGMPLERPDIEKPS